MSMEDSAEDLARAIIACDGCHVAVMRAIGVHAMPGEADLVRLGKAYRKVLYAAGFLNRWVSRYV
jgi:hypothetical protein